MQGLHCGPWWTAGSSRIKHLCSRNHQTCDRHLKLKMGKIHLVTCKKGAENAVQHIMLGEPIVGLACTGVTVGPKGKLSLVVLTTEKGDAFAFDVKKHPDIMYQGLGRVLQSVHVLKVVHGSGPIAANLQAQFGVFLQNIYDTQAAFSQVLENIGLCPRIVPLSALCEKFGIQQYTPSPQFQKLLSEDVHAWARRPLNRDMLNTAAAKALPLVPTLYKQLFGNGTTTRKVHWDNRFRMLSDKADLSLLKTKHGLELPQEVSDRSGSRSPVLRLSLAQRMLLLNTVPPAAQGQVSTGGFC